ncbi:hypothetical protein [uncultured Arcticibacterium sp.]|uniref:hypothetical protein n=1 Tax=uncultured Arcticibacterium sp. TaxID=2173042 RepID=UPI0030F9C476
MKKIQFKHFTILLFISFTILSCTENEHEIEPDNLTEEHKYLRLLVSDEVENSLYLVAPLSGMVTSFDAKFPKSALYKSDAGRFVGIVHRENNFIEFFDSGFEFHGNHVDVRGTPKFGAMVGESLQPTHFKSKNDEILIFNDGDGTLSLASESEIQSTGVKMKTINAGLLKHHGAMAIFSNGTYAVTEKDNSIAGALPERVKIIDKQGNTLHNSQIATQGIHGNATDGNYAVFGSASGVLVVESSGEQKLIPHPEDFDTAWFGSILETSTPGKFVGYTAAKGAYLIDVNTDSVSPIFESTDIMQCKISYNSSKLGVLLHSGDFKLFDLSTSSLLKEGTIINSTESASTQKPQIELTERFIYVTQPMKGEILKILLSNFSNKENIKVGNTPYRIALLGPESSEDH